MESGHGDRGLDEERAVTCIHWAEKEMAALQCSCLEDPWTEETGGLLP